jgi:hypothetical protein
MNGEDSSRFTVQILLIALAHNDQPNYKVCAKSVLRSSFNHLYDSYRLDTPENGEAMSTFITLAGQIEEAEHDG